MTNLYKIPEIQWAESLQGALEAETLVKYYKITKNVSHKKDSDKPYMVWYSGKVKFFDTVSEAKDWVEHTHYPSVLLKAGFEQVSEPTQREQIIQSVNTLVAICHGASKSAGWWNDLATGEPLKRNKGEMLMLMVSELAEAMEADRKNLNDDHLPQYDGVSVELADCMVRICDFVGGFDLKTAEAMADKIEYNASRADHKIENRLKDNGKKY